MSRVIAACLPLAEKWQTKIREEAEKRGFTFLYYSSEEQALPAAAEAEILFTSCSDRFWLYC